MTLEILSLVLVLLWIVGFMSSYTLGGLIHLLLVVAVISIAIRFIQGRHKS